MCATLWLTIVSYELLLRVAHALGRCKYEEIANALYGQIGRRIVDIAYDEFSMVLIIFYYIFHCTNRSVSLMFGGIVGMTVLSGNLGQELVVQLLPPDAVCFHVFLLFVCNDFVSHSSYD